MATKVVNPLPRYAALVVCVALLVGLVSPGLRAEKADRNKQTVLEASKVTIDDVSGLRTAFGPVVLTKGTLLIKADRMEYREDGQGYISVVAIGKPATFRQKRDGLDQYIEGSGERLDWTDKNDVVKLQQRATMKRVEQGKLADEVFGSVIVYDAKTEQYSVEGGPQARSSENPGGRVRMVIQPRSPDPAPAPAAKP
jgi:lipopolysaccharide export system protein LptA